MFTSILDPNGMCSLLPTLMQEMPLCSSNLKSSRNTAEDRRRLCWRGIKKLLT